MCVGLVVVCCWWVCWSCGFVGLWVGVLSFGARLVGSLACVSCSSCFVFLLFLSCAYKYACKCACGCCLGVVWVCGGAVFVCVCVCVCVWSCVVFLCLAARVAVGALRDVGGCVAICLGWCVDAGCVLSCPAVPGIGLGGVGWGIVGRSVVRVLGHGVCWCARCGLAFQFSDVRYVSLSYVNNRSVDTCGSSVLNYLI